MKKIRWATHKSLFGQIASSSCLLGGSAGLIFGISAGTFKINYLALNDIQARVNAATSTNFYSQNINSQWNMNEKKNDKGEVTVEGYQQPLTADLKSEAGKKWWEDLHGKTSEGIYPLYQKYNDINPDDMELTIPVGTGISSDAEKVRKQYATLVIDGATHTALDRSFNQSLYTGIANWIKNMPDDGSVEGKAQIYKPSQDSTQEFVNVYREAVQHSRILCLAGFNHVTPLNALGKQNGAKFDFGTDLAIKNAGMLLIDGDISNNQNIASVLFRSDQPAFLTGLATCVYFMNNLELYHKNFRDISVAAYGGTAIPTVTIYMGGFQRGVEFFNNMILLPYWIHTPLDTYLKTGEATESHFEKILSTSKYKGEIDALIGKATEEQKTEYEKKLYDEFSVKMIKLGAFGTHFSGSFAAGDAIGISKQLLNRGASAIIAVAGPQSLDTAQEIMNQKSDCIVIGVDCPMENSDYQKPATNGYKDKAKASDGTQSAQADKIIKFSAVKDMTSVSEKIIRLAANGKNWDVSNSKPWKSTSQIPSYTDAEIYPESKIKTVNNNDGETFDVIGIVDMDSPAVTPHVLSIPLTKQDGQKTLRLNAIRQPKDATEIDSGLCFNATSLKWFDTLVFTGSLPDGKKVTFGDKAFNYTLKGQFYDQQSAVDEETMKESGFKYIDLRNIHPNNIVVADNTTPFAGIAGLNDKTTARAYKKGIIKFGESKSEETIEIAFTKLFGVSGVEDTNWAIIEADPYKSICSFGFKTCGNIENGLISISWDGWAFLVEALNAIKYVDILDEGGGGGEIDFNTIWQRSATQYEGELRKAGAIPTELQTFLNKAKTATFDGTGGSERLSTFNTESTFYKNYSHTMAILGRMLNRAYLSFPVNMSIVFDAAGKPQVPEQPVPSTILDWLKTNMYFTV